MPTPSSPWPKRVLGFCALLTLPFCWACSGSGLNEVQGSVNYQGQPAKGAVLTFHLKGGTAKSQIPSGSAGEDGTFTLMTGSKVGAPAGDYSVTVNWPEVVGGGDTKTKKPIGTEFGTAPETVDRLKGRYANPSTTPLQATIKSGRNKLEPFDLK
jgi:hypothetical protein